MQKYVVAQARETRMVWPKLGRWLTATAIIVGMASPAKSKDPILPPGHHSVGDPFKDCPSCPEMTVIPAGATVLDAKSGTDRRPGSVEDPNGGEFIVSHRVTMPKPLAVGIFDVTKAEYEEFVRETHRSTDNGCYVWQRDTWIEDRSASWRNPGFRQTPNDPVVCISWYDAQDYVAWLNKKVWPVADRDAATRYRLPRWGEAEYAARAGTKSNYYWGGEFDRRYGNLGKADCLPCGPAKIDQDRWLYTSPVGSFLPNAFGLFDEAGNVWQWMDECFTNELSPPPNQQCFNAPARGGSWLINPEFAQIKEFRSLARHNRNTDTGFRVVKSFNQ